MKTYNLTQIIEGQTFDHSLTGYSDKRFDKKGIFKKVTFKDGVAYCKRSDTGEDVMMITLHIQGFYKMYMYRYYTGKSLGIFSRWKARFTLLRCLGKRRIYLLLVALGIKKKR